MANELAGPLTTEWLVANIGGVTEKHAPALLAQLDELRVGDVRGVVDLGAYEERDKQMATAGIARLHINAIVDFALSNKSKTCLRSFPTSWATRVGVKHLIVLFSSFGLVLWLGRVGVRHDDKPFVVASSSIKLEVLADELVWKPASGDLTDDEMVKVTIKPRQGPMELPTAVALVNGKVTRDHIPLLVRASEALWEATGGMKRDSAKVASIAPLQPEAVIRVLRNASEWKNAEALAAALKVAWATARLDERKVTLLELGGVAAILDAMRDPRGIESARRGCHALWELALAAENQAPMFELGVANVIIWTMNGNGDAELARCRCGVLGMLAMPDLNQVPLVKLGAGRLVLSLVDVHMSNTEVIAAALGALVNLIVVPENRRPLFEEGAGRVAGERLRSDPTNVDIVVRGCIVIWNIARVPEYRAPLRGWSADVDVTKAKIAHPDNRDVQRFCGRALAALR